MVQYTKRAEELKCMLNLGNQSKSDLNPEQQSTSTDSDQQNCYDEVDSKVVEKGVENVPVLHRITNSNSLKNLSKNFLRSNVRRMT